MRAAILHEDLAPDARPDERDVLAQVELAEAALAELGCAAAPMPVSLDLEALRNRLRLNPPDVVVNLVEGLGGHGRLLHLVPALLEAEHLPFTGAGSLALALTTDKLETKRRLRDAGLPTPDWWTGAAPPAPDALAQACILKPVHDDASIGIDDDAVLRGASESEILDELQRRGERTRDEYFAEAYIDGREFNLSAIADGGVCRVLPPAEILFPSFPPDKPRIVGYAAKWEPRSFEYAHTPRRFTAAASDIGLHGALVELTRRCWSLLGLRGFARVDFRVDGEGRPWILEVNANPCLAPDAGFLAAAVEAGLAPRDVMKLLLSDALGAAS